QLMEQAPSFYWGRAEQEWGKDYPALTAEDRAYLQGHIARYIRPATPEEVRAGMAQPNEPILDAAFREVMAQLATSRAQASQVAISSSKAAKENAARPAAAARGKPSAPPPPSAKLPPRDRAKESGDAFALMERASSGRF